MANPKKKDAYIWSTSCAITWIMIKTNEGIKTG